MRMCSRQKLTIPSGLTMRGLAGGAWVECLEDIVGHVAVGTNKESV